MHRTRSSVASGPKRWALCGGGNPPAAPSLLDDVPASPASRRLASASPASQSAHRFALDATRVRYHLVEEDVMAKGNNARKKETKKPKKDKK